MITKPQIRNSLVILPENVTIDQVIDQMIFIEKIQKGLDDSKNGKVNTKEETKKKLNKWIKSTIQPVHTEGISLSHLHAKMLSKSKSTFCEPWNEMCQNKVLNSVSYLCIQFNI